MDEKEKEQLKDALLTAITAAKETTQATGFVFSSEDITKIALSVYIDRGKNGRVERINGRKQALKAPPAAPAKPAATPKPAAAEGPVPPPEAPAQVSPPAPGAGRTDGNGNSRSKLVGRLFWLAKQFTGENVSDEQRKAWLHQWLRTDSLRKLSDEQIDRANRLLYEQIKKRKAT